MANKTKKINFELLTDQMLPINRSIVVSDDNLVHPYSAVTLLDGEWCTYDGHGKLKRVTDIATPGNTGSYPENNNSFPIYNERGRYDVQATTEKMTTVLYIAQGLYEAATRIFDDTVTYAYGAPLKVATVQIEVDGSPRYASGLTLHGGTGDNDPVVGYVTKPVKDGKLTFRSGSRNF
jgi:hypothetical protein